MGLDNKILIAKLKDNDSSAWREIVNLYSDRLFAYALSLCSDPEHSSDIVQDVFINVFINSFLIMGLLKA